MQRRVGHVERRFLSESMDRYPKELTTACKLFGISLKSVEAKTRKGLKDAEQSPENAEAAGAGTTSGTAPQES